MQKWTQEEAIAFECAREVISDWMSIQTGRIYEENERKNPDNELIERLRAERSRLFGERAQLRLKDHAAVERIRNYYGERVRAWREKTLNGSSNSKNLVHDEKSKFAQT